MKRRAFLATAGATTLVLMGCGAQSSSKGAGPSVSAVTVLTPHERSTAIAALQGFLRSGQDVGQFTASATKATMGAYLDHFGGDVVVGTNPPTARDGIVLVAGLAGPVDTSSMRRPYGYIPVGSGAIAVFDSTGAGLGRLLLLDGGLPDLARLGGPVEALDLASD